MTRTVLVFGGSRGIGAACVGALSAAGWQVAYTYVNRPGDGPGTGYAADIRDPAAVAGVFEQVEAAFGGRVDAVVANAGINVPGAPVGQFKPEHFRELIEVNLVGAFNILAEAARRVGGGWRGRSWR